MGGTASSVLDPGDCEPTPRERLARFGRGGGGISSASVSARDTERLGADAVFILCALERLGNAGGRSSSGLRSVSVSDPSSSSSSSAPASGGDTWNEMPGELDVLVSGRGAAGVPVDSQYLSSEVIGVADSCLSLSKDQLALTHAMSTPDRNHHQRRPATISELSERALENLYDENKPFKHSLRIAEQSRKDARDYHSRGDLENAFIYFARAATLVLDKLPMHREFYTLLKPHQRSNLNLVRTFPFLHAITRLVRISIMDPVIPTFSSQPHFNTIDARLHRMVQTCWKILVISNASSPNATKNGCGSILMAMSPYHQRALLPRMIPTQVFDVVLIISLGKMSLTSWMTSTSSRRGNAGKTERGTLTKIEVSSSPHNLYFIPRKRKRKLLLWLRFQLGSFPFRGYRTAKRTSCEPLLGQTVLSKDI